MLTNGLIIVQKYNLSSSKMPFQNLLPRTPYYKNLQNDTT